MNDVDLTGSYLAEIGIGGGTPSISTLGKISANSLSVLAARSSIAVSEPATWFLLMSGFWVWYPISHEDLKNRFNCCIPFLKQSL